MSISFVTANIGSIDPIQGIPRQSVECDFNYYNDHNLPFPLPNLNSRLKSKYIKIQTHKFLECDVMIWLDGRVKVISRHFAEAFIEALGENDIVMFKHPERATVKEEMDYIISQMNAGNHYLLSRYGDQQLEMEYEYYCENDFENEPLRACTVFARKMDGIPNLAFNDWWEKCLQYSYFDQTMFSAIAKIHSLKVKELDMKDWTKHLRINKHLL